MNDRGKKRLLSDAEERWQDTKTKTVDFISPKEILRTTRKILHRKLREKYA